MNWIKQLKDGQSITPSLDFYAYVENGEVKSTQAGKEYLDANISDGSSSINCKVWAVNQNMKDALKSGNCISVEAGAVGIYNDKPQLKLTRVLLVEISEGVKKGLLPQSNQDIGSLLTSFHAFIKEPWQNQIMAKFQDKFETVWEKFITYPAAKSVHHAYIRGLIEHSVSVATIATSMAKALKKGGYEVNIPVVSFGALIHDIGKIQEFEINPAGLCDDYTPAGNLIGHLSLGVPMFASISTGSDISNNDKLNIMHIIASHHDKAEWGAVKPPSTIEAMIVAKADMIDCEANMIRREFKDNEDTKVRTYHMGTVYKL